MSVTDTGCGNRPRTLSANLRTVLHDKGDWQGNGLLGLATVFGIVEQHRGWIEVESEVGSGTTFHIFFPEADIREAPTTVTSLGDQRPRGSETISFWSKTRQT